MKKLSISYAIATALVFIFVAVTSIFPEGMKNNYQRAMAVFGVAIMILGGTGISVAIREGTGSGVGLIAILFAVVVMFTSPFVLDSAFAGAIAAMFAGVGVGVGAIVVAGVNANLKINIIKTIIYTIVVITINSAIIYYGSIIL